MKESNPLFSRPLTIIGYLTVIHSLMYGIGYCIPGAGFSETVLYENVSSITEPAVFGAMLLVVSMFSLYAWLEDKARLIEWTSSLQALVWLFATFSYFLHGDFALGIGVGLVWSLLSGYLGFAYKAKDDTVMYHANKRFMQILDGPE